jgi:S-adenosylmethionine synthetase
VECLKLTNLGPKNVVAINQAERRMIPVSYAIGVMHILSLHAEIIGTVGIPIKNIAELDDGHFDLLPDAIIQDLDPHLAIYHQAFIYGLFIIRRTRPVWETLRKRRYLCATVGVNAAVPGK